MLYLQNFNVDMDEIYECWNIRLNFWDKLIIYHIKGSFFQNLDCVEVLD